MVNGKCVTRPRLWHSQRGPRKSWGCPTANGRLTRSRQGGSKRAASGRTPRHRGRTQAGFVGRGRGGGAPLKAVGLGRWLVAGAVGVWEGGRGCAGVQRGAAQGRSVGRR